MTHRERFNRAMHFQPVDRLPNEEFGYWGETLERWQAEGMPADADEELYFGLDIRRERRLIHLNSAIFAEADTFRVASLADLERKQAIINPCHHDYYPADWPQRVEEYRHRDYPLGLDLCGCFGLVRAWMGLANCCIGYYEQPELMHALGEYWAYLSIESARKALTEVELDFVQIWEDMAYNHGSLIAPHSFREFMTPYYQQVTRFIKSHGVDVILVDCDGDTTDMIELFVEAGVTGLYPLEVVAGTDAYAIRRRFPDFRLLGHVDKLALAAGPDAIDAEIARLAPLVAMGGFIPFTDHRVPPDVTLANFQYYMLKKRELLGGDLTPTQAELAAAREKARQPVAAWEYRPSGVGPSLE